MEKEGLVRGLDFIEENDLSIDLLVTDRHKQIDSWLRKTKPEIHHRYDIWHVAKCKCDHFTVIDILVQNIFLKNHSQGLTSIASPSSILQYLCYYCIITVYSTS